MGLGVGLRCSLLIVDLLGDLERLLGPSPAELLLLLLGAGLWCRSRGPPRPLVVLSGDDDELESSLDDELPDELSESDEDELSELLPEVDERPLLCFALPRVPSSVFSVLITIILVSVFSVNKEKTYKIKNTKNLIQKR